MKMVNWKKNLVQYPKRSYVIYFSGMNKQKIQYSYQVDFVTSSG